MSLKDRLNTIKTKSENLTKKEITIDPPTPIDNTLLLENEKNIASQDLETMKQYLNSLINGIKAEELDEKNLINIYSNSVYEYNIDILKKQIEFVKSKINAEKNFNLNVTSFSHYNMNFASSNQCRIICIKTFF